VLNHRAGRTERESKSPMIADCIGTSLRGIPAAQSDDRFSTRCGVLELSDGTSICESNAILYWLAEGTPLMPENRLDRSRMIQWMCFEQDRLDKVLGRARFFKAFPHFSA
jgi:hypothetical protein